MASGQVFELALLLSLKDLASGKLDNVQAQLRKTGKEGKALLKNFQDLRSELNKGLTIGGIGIGILAGMRNGINAAGEYEMSLLDLRSAYQEAANAGGLSIQAQAAQLNRLDQLAVRLGNNLQGSTSDYIGILASLKKSGVETETVLAGAGEAAANLANVSGALLAGRANEQAKELGQFGKMFKLRPEEFKKSVDLFSALKDRFDIESSEIIESAKYFQNTANSLKLTGFGGAEETSKFFALAKRFGAMEGSQAGTSATSFFQQFIAKADQRAKIKKATGLDIQLFDKKGEFMGMENAFREMEKFRKFSSEKRLSLLNEIFGEQGGKIAGVMVEAGAEGWRSITSEAKKAVPVQEKINQQMATYNAKMEALQGTLTNLKAVAFTPMLDTVKPLVDVANNVAGWAQEFAKANPELAGIITKGMGLVGLSLTLVGGFKAMRAAWGLWRIASAVGAHEDNLIRFLRNTKVGADGAGDALGGASRKAGGLRGQLSALSALKAIVLTVVVTYTIEQVIEGYNAIEDYKKSLEAEGRARKGNIGALSKLETESARAGVKVDPRIYRSDASSIFSSLNREDQLLKSLRGGNFASEFGKFWTFQQTNPYGSLWYQDKMAQRVVKERGEGLSNVNVMREFIDVVKRNMPAEDANTFLKSVQAAFPEAFKQATEATTQNLQSIVQPAKDVADAFGQCVDPAMKLPPALQRSAEAATAFAARVNALQLNSPQFNSSPAFPSFSLTPGAGPQATTGTPPKSAIGSVVQKSGLAEVHRGNVITPAGLSRRSPGDWLSDFQALKTTASRGAQNGGSFKPQAIVNTPSPLTAPMQPQRAVNSFIRVNNDSDFRVNLRENSYNIAETARAVMRNESTNIFQPNIKLGDIEVTAGPGGDVEAVVSRVREEQNRQLEELRRQLKDAMSMRRFDRMGARVVQIGRERA